MEADKRNMFKIMCAYWEKWHNDTKHMSDRALFSNSNKTNKFIDEIIRINPNNLPQKHFETLKGHVCRISKVYTAYPLPPEVAALFKRKKKKNKRKKTKGKKTSFYTKQSSQTHVNTQQQKKRTIIDVTGDNNAETPLPKIRRLDQHNTNAKTCFDKLLNMHKNNNTTLSVSNIQFANNRNPKIQYK
eukprot:509508_1